MPAKPRARPKDDDQALRVAEAELAKAVVARREGRGDARGVLRAGRKLKALAGSLANRKPGPDGQ